MTAVLPEETTSSEEPGPVPSPSIGRRLRTISRRVADGVALLLLWFALVLPDKLNLLTPRHLLQIPLELLLVVIIAVAARGRWRTAAVALTGLVTGLLVILKVLDMGFFTTLDRPFDPVDDWAALRPALGVVRDSLGQERTTIIVTVVVAVATVMLVAIVWSALRVAAVVGRQRSRATRAAGALAVAWMVTAVAGAGFGAHLPGATGATASVVAQQVDQARSAIHDGHVFRSLLRAPDPAATTPPAELLTALRGKDVLVVFVESYGAVAVGGSSFAPQVKKTLTTETGRLATAGFSTRSAYLTSPTFGGGSWFAHSTLQSGLWVPNQQRYDELVGSNRFTLNQAFHRAGWRTAVDVPSDEGPWSQGSSFYHYDAVYGARDVGYKGPKFSYAAMPDQYVLAAFQRMELDRPGRGPVMAEIDLVSSHTPWTPLPRMVRWNELGDGSIYDGMPAQGVSPQKLWRHASFVQQSYGTSIQYSLTALSSFVQQLHDPNLVVIALGDHQPATIVTGQGASHDVPITIIAHDPKVFDHIASWGWQPGMLPDAHAPVWRMDIFRDRFLTAFR